MYNLSEDAVVFYLSLRGTKRVAEQPRHFEDETNPQKRNAPYLGRVNMQLNICLNRMPYIRSLPSDTNKNNKPTHSEVNLS